MTTTSSRARNARPAGPTWAAAVLTAALGTAAFLGSSAGPAAAQVMLYENRIPDGFAYVRFANTLSDAVTVKPAGFGDVVTLGKGEADRVSAYYTVEKVAGRKLEVDLADGAVGRAAFELKPAAFHTVLIGREGTGGTAKVVADQSEINQNRARLAFYNAVPGCASAALQAEPGNASVFNGIAPGTMRGRSVNPSPDVHVKASCGSGASSTSLDLGRLEAGGQYSVWLMAPAGAPIAFRSENMIAPYLR